MSVASSRNDEFTYGALRHALLFFSWHAPRTPICWTRPCFICVHPGGVRTRCATYLGVISRTRGSRHVRTGAFTRVRFAPARSAQLELPFSSTWDRRFETKESNMWSLSVLTVCCVSVAATAQSSIYPSLEGVTEATPAPGLYAAVVNYLFDQVLKAVSQSGAIDPLTVPNTTRRFETKFIVKVQAEAGLYSGRLTGLSTMHRTGDCHVKVGSGGVEMRVDLGAGPVRATYRGEVKLMAFSQDVTIDCDVNNMQIIVEAVQAPNAKPELRRFAVQKLQGVRVAIHGLGALSGVANALSVVLTTVFEEEIRRAVEDSVRNLFSEKLAELGGTIPAALVALG